MMESLINYLLQYYNLNEQQIDFIYSNVNLRRLKKGSYFSEAGKVPDEIAFLQDGVFRVCYHDNLGDELTKYFIEENEFVVDINSYSQNIISTEYVQAVTDCKIFVFSKKTIFDLQQIIAPWNDIMNKIILKSLIKKVNRLSPMLSEDATSRYLNFLKIYPRLANRIPLSFIASYLGVTQSSLSRIRKNI